MAELQNNQSVRYKTIVIDPPWETPIFKRKVRPNQQEMPYKMMSLDEIKQFPINDFADENCWVFLWTFNKYLEESFNVLKVWGFKFQRLLTWDKKNGMCIFGFHHRTEFVLVGYRGNMAKVKFPKQKAIPTIFTELSKNHSSKPDIFFNLLQTMPEPRIDIFARKRHEGFDAWGNQIEPMTQLTLRR